jgi:hypothetical protein
LEAKKKGKKNGDILEYFGMPSNISGYLIISENIRGYLGISGSILEHPAIVGI